MTIQFHIRVYCVASGDLTVYLYTRMLALFSSKPFALPSPAPGDTIDLAPHLTNSSLQTTHRGEEEGVRLLDELVGCHILSRGVPDLPGSDPDSTLTSDHLASIQDQIADALAETFTAALQSPIHFQVRSFRMDAINILTWEPYSHCLTPLNSMELTFSSNTSHRLNHSYVSSFSKLTQNPR
jgi:Tubulin-tyrosine ligase family